MNVRSAPSEWDDRYIRSEYFADDGQIHLVSYELAAGLTQQDVIQGVIDRRRIAHRRICLGMSFLSGFAVGTLTTGMSILT